MRSLDIAVASVLFAIFVTMVAAAVGYPYEARLVPLVVGVPAMLLAGWQLSREVVKSRPTAQNPTIAVDRDSGSSTEGTSVAWLVLFAFMVLSGGFVIGGTIAVMACQRFWLRESWRTAIVGGAIAFFISHVCFERGLGLALFGGWIADWV